MKEISKLISKIRSLGYVPQCTFYNEESDLNMGNYSSRYWKISDSIADFVYSPFYYKEDTDFYHFTTIENAISILNSGTIRMYNLNNMDDKLELKFASKELNIENNNRYEKNEIFSLSLCSAKQIDKNIQKQHLLWKLYGNNGFGAMLKINFINNPVTWLHFYISKIYYGIEEFKFIKDLNRLSNRDRIDVLPASFIKHPIYSFEDEVRLIFDGRNTAKSYGPNGTLEFPIFMHDKHISKKDVTYFNLQIVNKMNVNDLTKFLIPNIAGINYTLPRIQISSIILGYRYKKKDQYQFMKKVDKALYDINIKVSNLSKYY